LNRTEIFLIKQSWALKTLVNSMTKSQIKEHFLRLSEFSGFITNSDFSG